MRHEKVYFPIPVNPNCLFLVPSLCDPLFAQTYNYLLWTTLSLPFQLEKHLNFPQLAFN